MTIATHSAAAEARTPPAVTVVIPAYNAARFIREALDSVLAQTVTDYEVIVVDDGSRDREALERILVEHPLPIVYLSQENRGVSAARNAAIRIARGEFYAQLDADDQWTPDYLEVQLGILRAHPQAALMYPNATIIREGSPGGFEFMKICPSEGEVTFASLLREQCVVMTCVTARLDAIRRAGLFDERLRGCEDFDLWLRLVMRGERILYHRQLLARYRRHEESLSSDGVWMQRHLLLVLAKCAATADLGPEEQEVLHQAIEDNRARLHLLEGKLHLTAGESGAALASFERANQHLRRPKLSAVIFLARHTPNLLGWVVTARDRILQAIPAHRLTDINTPNAATRAALRAGRVTQPGY